MKKLFLSLFFALLVALCTAGLYGCYLYASYRSDAPRGEGEVQALTDDDEPCATAAGADFSELDMSLYGKWASDADGLTYTVFTLDDAGDGFCWGKSWCVSDSVFEDDLVEHGNGWFRWRARKGRILFLHRTDLGIEIPIEYRLLRVEDEQMAMKPHLGRREDIYDRVFDTFVVEEN